MSCENDERHSDDNYCETCFTCHECLNTSQANDAEKLSYQAAAIAQQDQELEAKDKRIAELEGALTAIRERFKDKLSLHKDYCFAYQQAVKVLSND